MKKDDSSNCQKCLTMLNEALQHATNNSSKAAQLLQSLNNGQPVRIERSTATALTTHLKDFGELEMECKECSSFGAEGNARAFVMGNNDTADTTFSVVVCANRGIQSVAAMQQVLTHELIHIFDVHRLQLDLRQCSSLAYSEVRAAREAECAGEQQQQQKECARSKATNATMNLFPWKGRSCVNSVMDSAFVDERPFVQEQQQQPRPMAFSPQTSHR